MEGGTILFLKIHKRDSTIKRDYCIDHLKKFLVSQVILPSLTVTTSQDLDLFHVAIIWGHGS